MLRLRMLSCALIALASLISSCASRQPVSDQPMGDPSISGSMPASGSQDKTVVLFATGDLRGALLPIEPGHGGAALLEGYFKAASRKFDQNSRPVIWLDGGDLRGQSLDSGFDHGATFEKFIRESGISATFHQSPKTPAPSSGRILLTSATPVDTSSVTLVKAGSLRIGIVSAESAEELSQQAEKARSQGAQLVVWLSDLPIQCNPHSAGQRLLHKPGEPNGFCEGQVPDIVSNLPEGTINAVIASGNTGPLERFIYPRYSSNPVAGVPVVEASPFGRDFHLIELAYDLKAGKPDFAKTRIEGPIPVEQHQKVEADREIEALSGPAQAWLATQEKIVLASSSIDLSGVDLSGKAARESGLGDLIADALREETQSDFAIVHPGLLKYAPAKSALAAGPISPVDLARALPADTSVFVIPVTGEELKILVRISENGSRGFSSVSGMKLRLIRPDRDAPATDLNGDHALSLWERNRLLEMTDLNDDPIQAKHVYRLAVPGYLISGGDDWQWASQRFGLAQRIGQIGQAEHTGYPSARELVAQYLKRVGKIDSVPSRIRFENPPGRGRRHRHRSGHRARHKRHHRTSTSGLGTPASGRGTLSS